MSGRARGETPRLPLLGSLPQLARFAPGSGNQPDMARPCSTILGCAIRNVRYPTDWPSISLRIRHDRAGNRCELEGCGAINWQPHPITGSRVVLTVAHLDHDPGNCAEANLRAMCQRCHNRYDAAHRRATRQRRARP